MLSSAKIGRSSWRYYQASVAGGVCEYYTEHGERPGRWHGTGLAALGLEPGAVVAEAQLEALFARALSPTTGEQLGAGWREGSVTGYDLTFSAPKSVSALWALGDEEAVREVEAAHGAAVRAGLDYLQTHASYSRRGHNGVEQIASAGFAAALFDHATSRTGDPQIHTHALVVNKVQCVDGAWRTLDGYEIYHHKKSAGAIYQAALRVELGRRLGVRFGPVTEHGQAEITGTPTELVTAWSTRTTAVMADATPTIANREADLGRSLTPAERARVVKTAVLATRPAKDTHHHDTRDRRAVWAAHAAALGWDGTRLLAALTRGATRTPTPTTPTPTTTRGTGVANTQGAAAMDNAADPMDKNLDTTAAPMDNIVDNPAAAIGNPRTDDAESVPEQVRALLSDAVTAVGRTKAIWSRADLTVAVAARIHALPGPPPLDAAATVVLVEALTDTALTPDTTPSASTPVATPRIGPTPAVPPQTGVASSTPEEPSSARPPLRSTASDDGNPRTMPPPASAPPWAPPRVPGGGGSGGFASMPPSVPSMLDPAPATTASLAADGMAVGNVVGVVALAGGSPTSATVRASDARYASAELIELEARVIDQVLAGVRTRPVPLPHELLRFASTSPGGVALTGEQQRAVLQLAASQDLVTVMCAPAGAGKTTTLAAAVATWGAQGRPVVCLAPSARAAAELAGVTGIEGRTVASWLLAHRDDPGIRPGLHGIRPRPVLLVDESSMLSTVDLDALTGYAARADAALVMVGDPAQLGAVNAPGGMFEHLTNVLGPRRVELSGLHRFSHGWEAAATLRLRDGDPSVLTVYADHGRLHPEASTADAADAVFDRWHTVTQSGRDALMLAQAWTDVTGLNARARAAAIALGQVSGPDLLVVPTVSRSTRGQVEQRSWRAGDLLITRHNTPDIRLDGRGLRNGDRFRVLAPVTIDPVSIDPVSADPASSNWAGHLEQIRHGPQMKRRTHTRTPDGGAGLATRNHSSTVGGASAGGVGGVVGLRVQCLDTGATTILPVDYLARHVEYGWATTITAAQGATTDVAILLARPGLDREHLYVAMSRGRDENHVHASSELDTGDAGPHHHGANPAARHGSGTAAAGEQLTLPDPAVALDLLTRAVVTSGRERAAHSLLAPAVKDVREAAWCAAETRRPVPPVPLEHTRRVARLADAYTEQVAAGNRVTLLEGQLGAAREELAVLRFWSRTRREQLTTRIDTLTSALSYARVDLAGIATRVVELTAAVGQDTTSRERGAATASRARHDTWATEVPAPHRDPLLLPEHRRRPAAAAARWAYPDHDLHHDQGPVLSL